MEFVNHNLFKVKLERNDNYELRQKILGMSQTKASKLGIGKSELHYLRKKAKSDKPFKVYNKIEEKLG